MNLTQYNHKHRTQILHYADAYRTGDDADYESWLHFAYFNSLLVDRLPLFVWYRTGQPYKSQAEMGRDVAGGLLQVSRDHTAHPVWTDTQNLQFRAVHDWHHIQSNGKFTWPGDILACQSHLEALVYIGARRDEMTEVFDSECFGQNATAIMDRKFPSQRLVKIEGTVLK